jgi:CRP/FNR family cyclic AMP-dependent transcriptional regulator
MTGERPDEFLTLLPPEEREKLDALGRQKSFPAGAVMMYEGQAGEVIMVVLRGVVKITQTTAAGAEIVLGFCGEGELVGELSALDRQPRSSTVTAVHPVEALLVSASGFRSFIEGSPPAAVAIMRAMSRRFRDADRRVVEFGASDALGRVAARILELAEAYGRETANGVAITLPISQDELAGWAGCSKKAAVNALQTLRRLGCIETGRRAITVVDAAGLRARTASL